MHNLYGALQAESTYGGLSRRRGGTIRPFLLSRAFFVGSQRWGAVWTGDNTASWSHLQLSVAMTMALSVSGLPFGGADVGGFFGEPDHELLVRWYQAAAYLPFFRGHGHIETQRREPWLLPEETAALVVETLKERQRLLPYWNTLWWAASAEPSRGWAADRPPALAHLWRRRRRRRRHADGRRRRRRSCKSCSLWNSAGPSVPTCSSARL